MPSSVYTSSMMVFTFKCLYKFNDGLYIQVFIQVQ